MDPRAGQVTTPDGKTYIVEQGVRWVMYDEIVIPAGAVTANQSYTFFNAPTGKGILSTNMGSNKKIPGGTVFTCYFVGFRVLTTYGNTLTLAADARKIYENSAINFMINQTPLSKGPVTTFPSGYGLYGSSSETDTSFVENGFPSESGPDGVESFTIDDRFDLNPELVFSNRVPWDSSATMPTLANRTYARLELRGVLWMKFTIPS